VDLQLTGNLADDNGRARFTKAVDPEDPVLAGVLGDIRRVGPRKWGTWIDRHPRAIVREVRDDLERARLIKVEPHRVLGLFPADRITLRQPLVRRQVLQSATDTLRPARLVTVSTSAMRRSSYWPPPATCALSSPRISAPVTRTGSRKLAVRVGPVVPALKKSLQQAQASAG
jgi:Golgi phosphoprotein 3 GPP34